MLNKEVAWKIFSESGSIDAYFLYKDVSQNNPQSQESERNIYESSTNQNADNGWYSSQDKGDWKS